MYQEQYKQTKDEKEYEENEINRVYERFDYMKEGKEGIMGRRINVDRYNLRADMPIIEEQIVSETEMSDPATDLLYKRYKDYHYNSEKQTVDIAERAHQIRTEFKTTGQTKIKGWVTRNKRKVKDYLDMLVGK